MNGFDERQEMTTYISANVIKLYEAEFIADRKRTASGASSIQDEITGQEIFRSATPLSGRYAYDPMIVRFYEEKIQELQREVARYKELVRALLPSVDMEPAYLPRTRMMVSPEFKDRFLRKSGPTLRVPGHEL